MIERSRISTIDWVRGIAILSVILLHTLPTEVLVGSFSFLHIGQAVPLFLFITFFLSFKGEQERDDIFQSYFTKSRISKLLRQVVIPFFVVVGLQIGVSIVKNWNQISFWSLISGIQGRGPGSYYLWVYLQLWFLIPFLYWLFKRLKEYGFLILLLVCIALNYVCVRLGISESLYRLTCIRYLFLSVPAYMYLTKHKYNKTYNWLVTFGVILSLVFFFFLKNIDLSPFVLKLGWSTQQWPTYFWTLAVFSALLWCGNRIHSSNKFFQILCWLGRNSWYIFLAQMFILSYLKRDSFVFTSNSFVSSLCLILLTLFLSVVPALILDHFKNKKLFKNG